jgi:hypothetical protein
VMLMLVRPVCSTAFEQVSILQCRLTLIGVSSCIKLHGVQRKTVASLSDSYTPEASVLAENSSSAAAYKLSHLVALMASIIGYYSAKRCPLVEVILPTRDCAAADNKWGCCRQFGTASGRAHNSLAFSSEQTCLANPSQ